MGGHGHLLPDKTRTADAAIEAAAELGGAYEGFRYLALSIAALAAGDVAAADEANEAVWQHISLELEMSKISIWRRAQVALARGDLIAARRWADDAVSATTGWHLMDSYQRSDPGPISAGPVIESFEDRLELIASGQAIAVLPVGDRRRSLRADLATVPVEGVPTSRVVVATRVGDPNPLVADFVQAARAHLTGRTA